MGKKLILPVKNDLIIHNVVSFFVTIGNHWFTSVHIGSNWFKSVHIGSQRFTSVHIGSH